MAKLCFGLSDESLKHRLSKEIREKEKRRGSSLKKKKKTVKTIKKGTAPNKHTQAQYNTNHKN